MSNGNFKVRAIKDYEDWFTEGKIYEFINGQATYDSGFISAYYRDFNELIEGNEPEYNDVLEEVKEENESEEIQMKTDGNFKVKAIRDFRCSGERWLTKGKVYEYVNGECTLDSGFISGRYDNFEELVGRNKEYLDVLVEVKNCFAPIKIQLACISDKVMPDITRIGIKVKEIDEDLSNVDIADLLSLNLNGKFIENVQLVNSSNSSKYNKETKTITLGKNIGRFEDIHTFENNVEAIKFMNELVDTINAINEKLESQEKEIKVYAIKHTPDGMRYHFKSKEDLQVGDLVYCDTSMGLAYGVVDGTVYEHIKDFAQRKQCSKDRNNLK